MKVLCVMHADFETPGVIEDWAKQNNHEFSICKPYNGDDCLREEDFDFLIIMGGPQSPLKLIEFPYLNNEIKLVKRAISKNKIILGFCLGAQIIGEAFGAKTEPSPAKEVGVYDIILTDEGKKDHLFRDFQSYFPAIHWHNDMPGITENSIILAFSDGCPRQVVKYGKKIYGFQCHLEITYDGIKNMIYHCPEDLAPSKYTQSKEQLLNYDYSVINTYMINILDKLVSNSDN